MNSMDRTRASSLESSKRSTEKYESYTSSSNQNNTAHNRMPSLICSQRELSDDNSSSDHYYNQEYEKPTVSKTELKDQLDLLQCTVNKMFNVGAFDEMGSTCPSQNISDALKHEYCQMMYALKELESILSVKKKPPEAVAFTNSSSSANDSHVNKLQREIYYRDSLIKCLSDRLKVLCKANDKLISDYENQERMLSGELVSLKRQLEKTKDAMCALAMTKRYPNVQTNQSAESEMHYLRELLCSKEILIADLKHRLERLNHENIDIKREFENKSGSMSHCLSNQFDRDASYLKHLSEQMKAQINTLTDSLEFKNCIVNDLQTQLDCQSHGNSSRNYREQLKLVSDENRLLKAEVVKQTEMLEDFRNQLRIVSENSQFKDETIVELKRCLRRYSDNFVAISSNDQIVSTCRETKNNNLLTLLNSIKRYLNHQHSDLLQLLDSDPDSYHVLETFIFKLTNLVNEPRSHSNDIELFKEYLTNEINLKNDVGLFLTNNMVDNMDSIEKFHNQLNSLLSVDMDDGFHNCLREYLHQCYLSDDNLRLVVEHLVKVINNIPVKSIQDIDSCFDTVNRSTFMPVETVADKIPDSHDCCKLKLKLAEEELQQLSEKYIKEKDCLTKELRKIISERNELENNVKMLEDVASKDCSRIINLEKCKNEEIEKLSKEIESLKDLKANNIIFQELIKNLEDKVQEQNNEKKNLLETKTREINELQCQLSTELTNSASMKSHQNDNSICLEKLNTDNQCLLLKLTKCIDEKSNLEMKLCDVTSHMSEDKNSKSILCSLQMENKTLERKNYALTSEKSILECQMKKLKKQLEEINKNRRDDHIDTTVRREDAEESECEKKNEDDIEGILALMAGQLNEKTQSLEDMRRLIKREPHIKSDYLSEYQQNDQFGINQQLLAQKDSEILYLKSKLDCFQMHDSQNMNSTNVPFDVYEKQIPNETSFELQARVCELNQQLTERSNSVAYLQNLLKEKDSIIDNASRTIKLKNDSMIETERLMHLMQLQNANIKDELSTYYNGKGEMHVLKSSNNNFRDEIQRLQRDNDRLKESLRDNLKSERSKKFKSQSFDHLPQKPPPSSLRDNSVDQINKEIQKLYVNFEDKNNELKEFSLKEIKSRDKKLEDLKFEIQLKNDQVQQVLLENINLNDQIEDESQKSSNYQQIMIMKDELLEKLLKEKEKIRETFMTQLRDKNQELTEKSNTVYFLNVELHRLSSNVEILNVELQTVKNSEMLHASQSRTFKISETELCTLKEENSSLKFCINLKVAENETLKCELENQKIGNKHLSNHVDDLKTKLTEADTSVLKQAKENVVIQSSLSIVESETKVLIDNLKIQVREIKEDYDKISDINLRLEKASCDLKSENHSLKEIMERLENEKINYRDEIKTLLRKTDALTNSLSDSKERITEISNQVEKEKQQNRLLTDVINQNEHSKRLENTELELALQQLEGLSNDNWNFKNEIKRLHSIILHLEDLVKTNAEDVRQENRIKGLQMDNEEMTKDLERYQCSEKQLNDHIKRKSQECEVLAKEYQELLKLVEKYQQQICSLENKELITQRSLSDEMSKGELLQNELDRTKTQLLNLEENWSNCNNNWIEKYELLRENFEKMEHAYHEQKYQCDITKHDNEVLEATMADQCQEMESINQKNQQLYMEYLHLKENYDINQLQYEENNKELQKTNIQLSSQVEELTTELLSARMTHVNGNDSAVEELCSKVNNKFYSDRRYCSQPILNDMYQRVTDPTDHEQKSLIDFQTRYNDLCEQLDNMECQLESKDRRISILENCNESNAYKSCECERIKTDFVTLEKKYQRLHSDCFEITPDCCCGNQNHFSMQNHDIEVIKACTNELQETILTQNQELDHLKSSHQMLTHDYEMCCDKLAKLENQIMFATSEVGNWENRGHQRTETTEHMGSESNKSRKYSDNHLCVVQERDNLKQELINIHSRMTDVINHNSNLEEQVLTYRQKVANQNCIIENLKAQINNVESGYENEFDEHRRNNVGISGSARPYSKTGFHGEHYLNDEHCNGLNEEIKSLQRQLSLVQSKLNQPCERCVGLQEKLDEELMVKAELDEQYNRQCLNTDQLSSQLFDNRNLVEQLTADNHRLISLEDVNQCKINQLLERIEKSEECLQDKDIEVRESKKNVELLEKSLNATEFERRSLLNHMINISDKIECIPNDTTDGLKNELADCYEMINKIKQENNRISNDLYEKDKLLKNYNESLTVSAEEIEKLKSEINRRTNVSAKELNHLKDASVKIAEDLNYIQEKISVSYHTKETQTSYLKHDFSAIKPESLRSGKDDIDPSQLSDVTYSSTKTVSWRSTHTDKQEETDDGVLALQQAIDDYNILLNDIDVRKSSKLPLKESKHEHKSPAAKSNSSHFSIVNEKTTSSHPKTQVADVIYVDVDSEMPRVASRGEINIKGSIVEVASVHEFDSRQNVDFVEFLRNSNINVEYDETNETPDIYLGRVMEKYNELEEFFFASMKIQFKHTFADDTAELFENFSERLTDNMGILKEQCQHLNAVLATNTTEINSEVGEISELKLTTNDLKTLIDIITTVQMQMSALNIAFKHQYEVKYVKDSEIAKAKTSHLSLPYEIVWQTHDICNPDIVLDTKTVSQMPLTTDEKTVQSVELHVPESETIKIKDDSFLKKIQENELFAQKSNSTVTELLLEFHAAESMIRGIMDDTLSVKISTKESRIRDSKIRKSKIKEAKIKEEELRQEELKETLIKESELKNQSVREDIKLSNLPESQVKKQTDGEEMKLPKLTESQVKRQTDVEEMKLPKLTESQVKRQTDVEEMKLPKLTESHVKRQSDGEEIKLPKFKESQIKRQTDVEEMKLPKLTESQVKRQSDVEEMKLPKLTESQIKRQTHDEKLNSLQEVKSKIDIESDIEDVKSLHVIESVKLDIQNDSYVNSVPNKENIETSVEVINDILKSNDRDLNKSAGVQFLSPESTGLSIYSDSIEYVASRETLDDSLVIVCSVVPIDDKNEANIQVIELSAPEYREQAFKEESLTNNPGNDSLTRSSKLSSVKKSSQKQISTKIDSHLESLQDKEFQKIREIKLKCIESVDVPTSFDSVSIIQNKETTGDSMRINVATERNLDTFNDNVFLESDFGIQQQSLPLLITDKDEKQEGPIYLQNVAEGLHVKEGKTKNINKLEDSLSHASIGNFEKAMHQLNDIDFDNLDPSIDIKSRIRIYAAEIDYLNEKNLFHTYAINVMSDPSHYLYNSSFLGHLDSSLTTKAENIRSLENQFNFIPHVSDNEKLLMMKVLDSDFTYTKLFDSWIELQRNVPAQKINNDQLNDLKEQLEQCRSANVKDVIQADQIVKNLQWEKEKLTLQMQKMIDENDNLKEKLAASIETNSKPQALVTNQIPIKQSKIPLLRNSSIETPSNNLTKSISVTTKPSSDKLPPPPSSKSIISGDQLVSPDEVRLAIAGETSIEKLRRFAYLLAEDNFDLAAEIEKLLTTIEELRRQLKENCDILTETVEMLQNSETFVNDLEKKLSAETKKTQIISSRVDKLNDLNKDVILELQRILKGKAPAIDYDLDIQGRCNYLLECIKALEIENKRLEDINLGAGGNVQSEKAFDFLPTDDSGAMDFEFETVMQPNGAVSGILSLVYCNDASKTLNLTFDIQSSKDLRSITNATDGHRVTRFIFDKEAAQIPVSMSDDDPNLSFINYNNCDNLNNNCCHGNDSSCMFCSNLPASHSPYVNTSIEPIESIYHWTNDIGDQCLINESDYDNRSISNVAGLTEQIMESSSRNENTLSIVDDTLSDNTIFMPQFSHTRKHLSSSTQSLLNFYGQHNNFNNYRKPIYFRKLRDSY